jgi:hypothetical protein
MALLQRWSIGDCVKVVCLVLVIANLASDVRAQAPSGDEWRQGTTLAGFAGAGSSSSNTDISGGLSLGWEITPRFAIEGRGLWLGAGGDADAFAATLATLVAFDRARPIKPFALAGIGLYRTTIDSGASDVPSFYSSRMTSRGLRTETFTDFALAFGGGVDLFVSRHFALRPEITVQLAITSSQVHAVAVYGVQVAYHFESHPITPSARR